MPYKTPEDAKAANKRWRLANVEKNKSRIQKWREENPDRVLIKRLAWRDANREKVRDAHKRWCSANAEARKEQYRKYRLKHLFGITPADYDALLTHQEYRCAACAADLRSVPKKHRHLDHNHQTGVVRGILCQGCNTALGILQENPERMRALAVYIEIHDRVRSAARRVDESRRAA